MRPIWKGYLKIRLVTIPIQMYTAHISLRRMEFDLLHQQCKSKIIEQFFCPSCETAVVSDEVVKGFEYEKGKYELVSDEDLKAAQKGAIGAIEIIRFVDGAQVDPIYYCHAHYLTPRRGEAATEAFALFREAMVAEGKIALARVVIRNKEYMLAIRPHEGTLAAFTLHYPKEIRSTQEIKEMETVKAAKVDKRSLSLARNLIRKTSGEFVPEELTGDYSKTLQKIIQAKARNEQIGIVLKPKEKTIDLAEALEKSIERSWEKEPEMPHSRKQEPNIGLESV